MPLYRSEKPPILFNGHQDTTLKGHYDIFLRHSNDIYIDITYNDLT